MDSPIEILENIILMAQQTKNALGEEIING